MIAVNFASTNFCGFTLTSHNSDFTTLTGWTGGGTTEDASNNTVWYSDRYNSDDLAKSYYDDTHYVNDGDGVTQLLGGFYNWLVATAGTGLYSKTTGEVEDSICPRGFRLPAAYDEKSWDNLFTLIDESGTVATSIMRHVPYSAIIAGVYVPEWGAIGYLSDANWWASTAYNAISAYRVYMTNGASGATRVATIGKGLGESIRCVSR